LSQREKDLIQQRENFQSQETQNMAAGNTEYRQIEQQLVTTQAEIQQTAVGLENAGLQMRSAVTLFDRGLISLNEKSSRIAAYNILQSKLEALKKREVLLQQEKAALQVSLGQSRQTQSQQIGTLERWLIEVKQAREQAVAQHSDIAKRLQQENGNASERQQSRVRQIELQLEEVNQLLGDPASPDRIKVEAPFDGYIGYRDLSPGSPKVDAGPLIVLYKPDHIWVQLLVSPETAQELTSEKTNIKLFIPGFSSGLDEFTGRIEQKLALTDRRHVELRISAAPPGALVRKLAMGEEFRPRVRVSSQGFSAAGLLKQLPGAALIRQHAWLRVGLIFIAINLLLGLLIIAIIRLNNRRTRDPAWRSAEGNALLTVASGYAHSAAGTRAHARSEPLKLPDPSEKAGYIYNFTQDGRQDAAGPAGISLQQVSNPAANELGPQVDFRDGWDLGEKLNRSIITSDVDIPLLENLFRQIEQQGVWITPFIACAISAEIDANRLLGYSMKLSVKRLSAVRQKSELGPAFGDLARYFCVLQLFFPALVRQIIPHLQQGLTRALQIAFAKLQADPQMTDHWLNLLRELIPAFGDTCPEMCLGLAAPTTSAGLLI
jgi:hypothetical protein